MKWFDNPQSIEQLKKQYRQLAKKHHPDAGGNNEIMQAINAEYQLCEKLIFMRQSSTTYASAKNNYTSSTTTYQTYSQRQEPPKASSSSKSSGAETGNAQTKKSPFYEHSYTTPKYNTYDSHQASKKHGEYNPSTQRDNYSSYNSTHKQNPFATQQSPASATKKKPKVFLGGGIFGLIVGIICCGCSFLFLYDALLMSITLVGGLFVLIASILLLIYARNT